MHYRSLYRCFITGGFVLLCAPVCVQVPGGAHYAPHSPQTPLHRAGTRASVHGPQHWAVTTPRTQSSPGTQGGEPHAQRHTGPSGDPHTGRFSAHRGQLHWIIGHLLDRPSLNAHPPLHNPGDMELAMAGLGFPGSGRKRWWSFVITVIYHYLHYNSALGPLLGLGRSCLGCGEYLAGDLQLGTRCVLKLPWKSTAVNTKESLSYCLIIPTSEHSTSRDPPALGKA